MRTRMTMYTTDYQISDSWVPSRARDHSLNILGPPGPTGLTALTTGNYYCTNYYLTWVPYLTRALRPYVH